MKTNYCINSDNLAKMLSDLETLYYTPSIQIRSIGMDKEGIQWFSVSLTNSQRKDIIRKLPVVLLSERYEAR